MHNLKSVSELALTRLLLRALGLLAVIPSLVGNAVCCRMFFCPVLYLVCDEMSLLYIIYPDRKLVKDVVKDERPSYPVSR
jgi:hypothetical protein